MDAWGLGSSYDTYIRVQINRGRFVIFRMFNTKLRWNINLFLCFFAYFANNSKIFLQNIIY